MIKDKCFKAITLFQIRIDYIVNMIENIYNLFCYPLITLKLPWGLVNNKIKIKTTTEYFSLIGRVLPKWKMYNRGIKYKAK